MSAKVRLVSLYLLLAVALLSPAAGSEQEPEAGVDFDGVRELREQTEADGLLTADLKARVLELCDAAIAALETADRHQTEVARLDKERAGVGRLADALRADLSEPEEAPRIDIPGDATSEQAETLLARERSRLRAHRAALREASQAGLHPALNRARRISLLSRRETSLREIDKLRAELALLDARGVLIPSQVELAQRRVAYDERLVEMLEAAAKEINLRDAQAGLDEVVKACRQAAELSPALEDVATETEQFAQMLWGADGVVRKTEEVTHALSATRGHLADLDRIVQLTRRQFEASGYRGSVARWWPEVPEGFPEPGKIATDLRILKKTIPGVQHQVIRFEQQRSASRKLANQVVDDLETEAGELDPELNRAALDLFSLRRDLLDQLIQHYGRYSDQLVEQERTSEFLFGEVQRVESFLFEKLLWVRSVPRPVIPRVGDAVTIGNLQGRVSRIHIRATTITLWDRSEMIVPNKEFITTKLVNWTLSDSKRRVDIPLRVSYDADLATVKQTLVEVAGRNPDVHDDPPPVALLLEFGEDALKFELRYFVDFGQGLKTRDELHMAVDAAFREKGIAFALPQLNIRVPPGAQPARPAS
jgi:small-conductance mechanosensitive channel